MKSKIPIPQLQEFCPTLDEIQIFEPGFELMLVWDCIQINFFVCWALLGPDPDAQLLYE